MLNKLKYIKDYLWIPYITEVSNDYYRQWERREKERFEEGKI